MTVNKEYRKLLGKPKNLVLLFLLCNLMITLIEGKNLLIPLKKQRKATLT
jgi:hypothetical protein